MLSENERKNIIEKASERIVKNLDTMSGYSKLTYIQKLVNMLDDTHLVALDFAIDMVPVQTDKEKRA